MSITIEKLPDEPIVTVVFKDPVNFYAEVAPAFARIVEIRDNLVGVSKYYMIVDLTGIKPSFGDIVHTLGEARKAGEHRRADLPANMHLVGRGELFEMVANALGQRQYGGYSAPLHRTYEEALSAIRADIRARTASK
jgi:hypothetical protein